MLNSGIILCNDIIELIGVYFKNIKNKENIDFHCSLLTNPDCLGAWIKHYYSARMVRHNKLLSEIIMITNLRNTVGLISTDTTYLREALRISGTSQWLEWLEPCLNIYRIN